MNMTFLEVANEWLDTHKGSIGYATQVSYKCTINLLKPVHTKVFTDIKYADLQKVINDIYAQGYSKSQLQKIMVVLTLVYRHAIRQEYTEKNIAELLYISNNASCKRRDKISEVSIEKILSFPHQYQLYYVLLYYTGIRKGEALALQWSDVDFIKKVIKINKSVCFVNNQPVIKDPKTDNGYRLIPITDGLLELLKQKRGTKNGYIFTQVTTGLPHTSSSFKKMHKRWLKDLKAYYPEENIENITSHMLRHTYITYLFENNLPDYVVKEIAGHSDAAFTKRQYYHVSKKYLEANFEMVRNLF